jgi:hypothetical protein
MHVGKLETVQTKVDKLCDSPLRRGYARTTGEILEKFDAYAIGKVNETYERFIF